MGQHAGAQALSPLREQTEHGTEDGNHQHVLPPLVSVGSAEDDALQDDSSRRGLRPDSAFVRRSAELQAKTFENVAQALLARRDEIHHPDPESAVRFAMLTIGLTAQGTIILPHNPADLSRLWPGIDEQVERELTRMLLRFLGIAG